MDVGGLRKILDYHLLVEVVFINDRESVRKVEDLWDKFGGKEL